MAYAFMSSGHLPLMMPVLLLAFVGEGVIVGLAWAEGCLKAVHVRNVAALKLACESGFGGTILRPCSTTTRGRNLQSQDAISSGFLKHFWCRSSLFSPAGLCNLLFCMESPRNGGSSEDSVWRELRRILSRFWLSWSLLKDLDKG